MTSHSDAILAALRAREDAVAVRHAERDVRADQLVELARDAEWLRKLARVPLGPGDVVGLRGHHPLVQVAAPLACWHAGISTYFVGAREPAEQLPALLTAAGCRLYVAWRPEG